MTYQLTTGDTILRLADNAWIPSDPANCDYREYQAWVADGNTPEPAPAPLPPLPPLSPLPPLTPVEKLAAAGLTVAELRQLLA